MLCHVNASDRRSARGVDQFTVRQWTAPFTPQLRVALTLPNREARPPRPCGAALAWTMAVYVVDRSQRAVRVDLPIDNPCERIRPEVGGPPPQ